MGVPLEIDKASKGELIGAFFTSLPDIQERVVDTEAVQHCSQIIYELRFRAVEKANLALLSEVHVLRVELRDTVQMIRANANGTNSLLLTPGMKEFHL